MKKKVIAGLLLSSCVLGVAMPAFAQDGTEADSQQTIDGENSAEIEVNGTLGADNTDPGATITEGDDNWINVTVPTKTIFYNTAANTDITSPTYEIVNNSGRPVDFTIASFVNDPGNATLDPVLPDDYELNLVITGKPAVKVATKDTDSNYTSTEPIMRLSNSKGMQTSDGNAVVGSNKVDFHYTGSATPEGQVQPKYTMTLKFDAVAW